MIYILHSFIVGTIMKVFFKKIYVSGVEKIPKDKPLFIVSNHPTGFWEPCMYACIFPFYLHFLTRGDLFKKNSIRWFLRGTHQIPIFRSKDGFSQLRENSLSRNEITDKLKDGARIVVFVEGSSAQVKHLRPLKKGVARMAYDAVTEYPSMDLHIVPVGVSFNDSNGFRSNAMIQVGEPIRFQDELPIFEQHEAKGKRILMKKIKESLQPLMIDVENEEVLELYEKSVVIGRNELGEKWLPVIEESNQNLKQEQQLITTLKNEIGDVEKSKISGYHQALTDFKIKDKVLSSNYSIMGSILLFVLLAPFALLGLLLNLIPTGIAFFLAIKVIPKSRFWSSLSALVRLVLHWYIYFPIMTILAMYWIGWPGIFFGPVTLFLEWIFYHWVEQGMLIVDKIKLTLLDKSKLQGLKTQRSNLISILKLKAK